ncbi:MAG: hypothetical protein KDA28_12870, partial [Phycisphaerales bacterium]|nr:hypothetical protein [Phycisphaerales bacterium]
MSDAKTCVKCGTDVSDKPRTKDKNGRYWCASCAKKAQAARQAKKAEQAPKDTGGGDLLDDLLKKSVAVQGKTCPECSTPLTNEAILCTH